MPHARLRASTFPRTGRQRGREFVMLMHHFNVVSEVAAPNSDSKKAYSELYKEKLTTTISRL